MLPCKPVEPTHEKQLKCDETCDEPRSRREFRMERQMVYSLSSLVILSLSPPEAF